MKHVSGDASRIFINTTLGCDSNCSYCYLGSQGLFTGKKTDTPVSAHYLLDALRGLPYFVEGRLGTILSIGCYSECWSPSNRETTTTLIKLLLNYENPIQFATKREIKDHQLKDIAYMQKWCGQVSAFISCSTFSKWKIYEKGTVRPSDRFRGIANIKTLGIKIYIYMKPVIDSVTIDDILDYCKILDKHNCQIIVGDEFEYSTTNTQKLNKAANIPSKNLYIKESTDSHKIVEFLTKRGYIVYRNSTSAINAARGLSYDK